MTIRNAKLFICLLFLLPAIACTGKTPHTSISPEAIARIDQRFQELTEKGAFRGAAIIAQGDNILLQAGYGYADLQKQTLNTPQTRFQIGSLTKQFTAMGVLLLASQGLLDLQEPVCSYLPDCPVDWQAITIQHLLTHSSGLADSRQFYEGKNLPDVTYAPAELLSWFQSAPLDFPPGEKFSYSNTGYLVLGYLIESLSGMPYADFLQEQIFTPLGMENSGYALDGSLDSVGYRTGNTQAATINPSLAYSAGGLYASAEDMLTWGRALLSTSPLDSDLISQMLSPQISVGDDSFAPRYEGLGYGYAWFTGERLGHKVAGHGGSYNGYRAFIELYPDEQIIIVVLSNMEAPDFSITTFPSEMLFTEQP